MCASWWTDKTAAECWHLQSLTWNSEMLGPTNAQKWCSKGLMWLRSGILHLCIILSNSQPATYTWLNYVWTMKCISSQIFLLLKLLLLKPNLQKSSQSPQPIVSSFSNKQTLQWFSNQPFSSDFWVVRSRLGWAGWDLTVQKRIHKLKRTMIWTETKLRQCQDLINTPPEGHNRHPI